MPLDVSGINSIINAFHAGVQARLEKQRLAQQQQQEIARQEEETAKLAQQKEEYESTLAQRQKEATAEAEFKQKGLDINEAVRRGQIITTQANLANSVSAGGNPPFGYKPVSTRQQEIYPGQFGTITTYSHPNGEAGGAPDFEALNPDDKIKLDAYRTQQVGEVGQQFALERLEKGGQIKGLMQEAENQFKLQAQREKSKADYSRALDVQHLRNQGAENVAQINATARKVATGETKLSTSENDKLTSLNSLYRAINNAKSLLEQDNYSYFQGLSLSGLMSNTKALRGETGATNPLWPQISTALGTLEQTYGLLESGKAISKIELDMIKSHLPDTSHLQSSAQVKSNLDYLLTEIPKITNDIYAAHAGLGNQNLRITPKKTSLDEIFK